MFGDRIVGLPRWLRNLSNSDSAFESLLSEIEWPRDRTGTRSTGASTSLRNSLARQSSEFGVTLAPTFSGPVHDGPPAECLRPTEARERVGYWHQNGHDAQIRVLRSGKQKGQSPWNVRTLPQSG